MILDFAFFWFVLLGSKLVLGAVVLYMLLPKDRHCAVCDAEVLPLESPRVLRRVLRLCHVQRYWCMECDRQSLGRPLPLRSRSDDRALRPVTEVRTR
jgi:hypothetical protein